MNLILARKSRAPDGSPIALGYHTGHWEVGKLVQAAAEAVSSRVFLAGLSPTRAMDARGTTGMMDSLIAMTLPWFCVA